MGSLGWEWCRWCWRWEYNPYLADGQRHPLCARCFDRWCDGLRPPWQPDALARCEAWLHTFLFGPRPRPADPLPDEISARVAAFLVDDQDP